MTENIKELKALIDLCRKSGIETIKLKDIEIKFSYPFEPIRKHKKSTKSTDHHPQVSNITDDTRIITDSLTEEQLLYYSVTDPLAAQ